jgi:hypothetical protein
LRPNNIGIWVYQYNMIIELFNNGGGPALVDSKERIFNSELLLYPKSDYINIIEELTTVNLKPAKR